MEKMKKILSLLLAAVLLFSMAACSNEETPDSTQGTQGGDGTQGTYTVQLKSAGGLALADVDVYIYTDNTKADLVDYSKTDVNGTVSFNIAKNDSYAIVLSGVPKGYEVKDFYTFSGARADIALTSSVIKDENLAGATLGLGDIMYDFSVTTPDGEKVTLSEVLKEKKMVLLNFWFSTCGPCANEFPYMEEAYQMYQDKVGIIAVDPLEESQVVGGYQSSMGLTFPMAACPAAWSTTFGITGYPTSIVIDRYGVICLIEVGGLTSLRPFTSIFERFTEDDYKQKLYNSLDELITNVKPTETMDSSENVGAILNQGDIEVTYRPEEGQDAEYAWPFIAAEKDGESCLKASNQQIDGSFAIMYADVTLKAGQAVGFDYLVSSEKSADIMYVIVDDNPIYQISGVETPEQWKSCYPWVAQEDGTYEVALCYIKDDSTNEGDDTVYLKNMRVVDAEDIDVATYIPRQAATSADGFDYSYVSIVLNEKDGYYHVGTKDGPLLLADLMNYTQFSEEQTLWDIAYSGAGQEYYEQMVDYFSLASNSALSGVCTVNKELGEYLKKIAKVAGFDSEDENEWLKLCKYYQVYGSGSTQLEDPIKGLTTFSAYEATLGKNVESNHFYYDRIIMPRGLFAKFVPTKSGVYRITSRSESTQGVDGWIFGEDRVELLVYEQDERLFNDSDEVSMVYYMEAGEAYYIDIAFWDPYEVGYIYYDIEYVAPTLQHFRLASPGYFTYDTNATGDAMYHLIAGGVKPVLGTDGKYYEDLGKDANGKQLYGGMLYADFTGLTAVFDTPIASVPAYDADGKPMYDENGKAVMVKGMIEKGGFDFSKTENDLYVLAVLERHGGDEAKADEYLREYWGEEYEQNAEEYQLEDVFAGIYHGTGKDYTAEMQTYVNQMITSGAEELRGCVPMTERLAELLQMLMDKYTFENVDHAWTKLCYYYDYLGPEA